MIIMRDACPGRGWKQMHIAFILCEASGRVIVPAPTQMFWMRVV